MSVLIPFIPDDAPFSPEQRAWLNGFLAGMFSSQPALTQPVAPSLKIAVLYATQSGTSERLARKLVKEISKSGHTA